MKQLPKEVSDIIQRVMAAFPGAVVGYIRWAHRCLMCESRIDENKTFCSKWCMEDHQIVQRRIAA